MAYLQRRNGRFYFQMRVGEQLALRLGASHIHCSLHTRNRKEAGRRLMTALDWGYEFKDARDLDDLGAALVRKLDALAAKGPPLDERALADRRVVEDMVANFIRRARERDFAFVAVPGLVALFKVFVDQNLAAEKGVSERAWPPMSAPVMTAEIGREIAIPAPSPIHGQSPATGAEIPPEGAAPDDLRSMLARLLDKIETFPAPVAPEASVATVSEQLRLSDATSRYLESERKRRGSARPDALLAPVFGFVVEFLGDKLLKEIVLEDFNQLDVALTEIPTLKGFSLKERSSLHMRYLRAREVGWDKLERSSITTVTLRYRRPVKLLFKWLRSKNLYSGLEPEFSAETGELTAALPRDRFEEHELLTFARAPIFTGCAERNRIWQPGGYFYQGDLYWIFLILMFSGMRTGEPPQIDLDDIVSLSVDFEDGGVEVLHF